MYIAMYRCKINRDDFQKKLIRERTKIDIILITITPVLPTGISTDTVNNQAHSKRTLFRRMNKRVDFNLYFTYARVCGTYFVMFFNFTDNKATGKERKEQDERSNIQS